MCESADGTAGYAKRADRLRVQATAQEGRYREVAPPIGGTMTWVPVSHDRALVSLV